MSFALGFIYAYVIGALACAMWLLSEMRRRNEEEKRGHEDYAMAAGAIIIAVFWLPIALVLLAIIIVALVAGALVPRPRA